MSAELTALSARVDELGEALTAAQATVDAKQDALAEAIAILTDMVNAGAATPAELDALRVKLEGALGQVADLTADVESTPVPDVVPPEPEPVDPPLPGQ